MSKDHDPGESNDANDSKHAVQSPWGESIDVGVGQAVPEVPLSGPSFMQMAMSASRALARFAASGFEAVAEPTHGARVQACESCRYRSETRCVLCGCFYDKKAWLPLEDCPIGRWPE